MNFRQNVLRQLPDGKFRPFDRDGTSLTSSIDRLLSEYVPGRQYYIVSHAKVLGDLKADFQNFIPASMTPQNTIDMGSDLGPKKNVELNWREDF